MQITIMESKHDPVSDFLHGKWYWAVKKNGTRLKHGTARSEAKARERAEEFARKEGLRTRPRPEPVYYTYEV